MRYLFGKDPLIEGHLYNFKGSYFEYVGEFPNMKDPDIPHRRCCYCVGQNVYTKKITYVTAKGPVQVKKHRDADDRLIDTTIRDTDNTLMVIAKEVIRHEEITHNEFKNLFDSSSDFNNFVRQIEKCDNLSFNRFADFLKRLGLEYELYVYKQLDGNRERIGGRS